jgi:hypothetical protein
MKHLVLVLLVLFFPSSLFAQQVETFATVTHSGNLGEATPAFGLEAHVHTPYVVSRLAFDSADKAAGGFSLRGSTQLELKALRAGVIFTRQDGGTYIKRTGWLRVGAGWRGLELTYRHPLWSNYGVNNTTGIEARAEGSSKRLVAFGELGRYRYTQSQLRSTGWAVTGGVGVRLIGRGQ